MATTTIWPSYIHSYTSHVNVEGSKRGLEVLYSTGPVSIMATHRIHGPRQKYQAFFHTQFSPSVLKTSPSEKANLDVTHPQLIQSCNAEASH